MALNKNVFDQPAAVPQINPYLSDTQTGMELVSQIISAEPKGQKSSYHRVVHLIDQLISSTDILRLDQELKLTARLMALSDRLAVPAKYRLLNKCTIIGVGGKFSSGKSAFLNTIIGADAAIRLPEEQTPSTAVPTYILRGAQESAYAYTIKGSQLTLDGDAVEAVSHAFKKKYGLGLAQYLSFLTITSPNFMKDIALLDTPGYNKPDSSMIESYSDEAKAFSQLRSIDFLIWLTDVTNGTLTADDIGFIRRLDISTDRILILINKCDLKPEKEVMEVMQRTKTDAKNAGLSIYDVVPYSSREPSLFNGKKSVYSFLEDARNSGLRAENVRNLLNEICGSIEEQFEKRKEELISTKKSIGTTIQASDDALNLKGLVAEYGQVSSELAALSRNKWKFTGTRKDILDALTQL